ncbi:glycoside hydrolase family 38 C-terminal domain-containing protein [Cohnella thailandensis]|uniref:Alpha-mannosidase n=1 Tax=Cohnella thailandensis TaxID=557557 RepID=A0A841T6V8_9BACL|nr:alpha-mannosidase [Cohnella thailandensis]MBP1974237.1 alpha-mannosidase [Cohnella thailandensis]
MENRVQTRRKAHIISHTHWDREWYLPYEKHHVRLIRLMDTLLDTLKRDDEYRSFFLDGQTIILEDYLQVRPERREELEQRIKENRIFIGPWYILQDAFLTSSEANLRNLLIGHQDAARYGTISKVGYFPDTFGNIGQAPQIMRQAGIGNAVFGRGVKPTGFNNTVADSEFESSYSELIWEGPDGSRVLGILFANWYSNGNEVPTDEAAAKEYWDRKLADAEKYASTNQLLYMNGCDHQPIQTDLPEAMRVARKLYPDTDFVHSNFADYLAALGGDELPAHLSVVKGELRSQRTDGWGTLVNTASARVYLKQMNQHGQTLLEKVAEPLAAIAHGLGRGEQGKGQGQEATLGSYSYPHHLFTYAWKTLMQNHPHDSICGCSVDEVHREMVTRFEKSKHVAESIVDESKQLVADAVDTSGFARFGEEALPLIAFNTTGWKRGGTISIVADVRRIYYREGLSPEEMISRLKALDLGGRVLVDAEGAAVPVKVEDLGVQFGYDLPDDAFRQAYWARQVRLTFAASDVPALGWKTYAWVKSASAASAAAPEAASIVRGERTLDNGTLRVEVADDGTLTVTDLASGHAYRDLLVYEDTGDIGNEYMYKQPEGEEALTTRGLAAEIRVACDEVYRATIEIVHRWAVPASADALFEEEKQYAVYFPERKAQRVAETVPLTIRTLVSLEKDGKGVAVRASFNNQAKDHRVRALFPTDLQASVHRADAIFEVAVRDNEPAAEWQNPSNAQHQQAFVDVSEADLSRGLTIANKGLNEYEVLRDGRNTIAVTLLRSVAELGDWGVFPTPEAQCLGDHEVELMIIPHEGDGAVSGAYAEAYQFQVPWTSAQTGAHQGQLAPVGAAYAWEGEGLAFSSLKINEKDGGAMLRWFNLRQQPAELKLAAPNASVYRSDVLENRGEALALGADGSLSLPIGPCEIVTIGVEATK